MKSEQLEQTQLFDLSDTFSLSGDQPVTTKKFAPPVHEQKSALFGQDTMKRDYERIKDNG